MTDQPWWGKARTREEEKDKTEGIGLRGRCVQHDHSKSWELLLLFEIC
jgi:hypothetical protein